MRIKQIHLDIAIDLVIIFAFIGCLSMATLSIIGN